MREQGKGIKIEMILSTTQKSNDRVREETKGKLRKKEKRRGVVAGGGILMVVEKW